MSGFSVPEHNKVFSSRESVALDIPVGTPALHGRQRPRVECGGRGGTTPATVRVTATKADGSSVEFDAVVRIDTPGEADYYRNGGILQYVLRNMLKASSS